MNLRAWFAKHSLKLLAIDDTPYAIAMGVAIGIFFGFTPLFGLKTGLSLLFAWLLRGNVLAAVIGVALHTIALPFMPVVFRLEYDLGYWLLSNPHQFPRGILHAHLEPDVWLRWANFASIGGPMLFGSIFFSTPFGGIAYFVTKKLITRYRKKRMLTRAEPKPD